MEEIGNLIQECEDIKRVSAYLSKKEDKLKDLIADMVESIWEGAKLEYRILPLGATSWFEIRKGEETLFKSGNAYYDRIGALKEIYQRIQNELS